MKKKFMGLAVYVLISYGSFSQTAGLDKLNLPTGIMSTRLEIKSEKAITRIDLKTTKSLDRLFPQARNVSWTTNENGIFAYLTVDSVKIRSDFDKKGNWLFNLRYYYEPALSQKVRSMVKSVYYDLNIIGVYEIESADKTVYLVNLEDKKSYKTILVHDDEMEVYNSFDKN